MQIIINHTTHPYERRNQADNLSFLSLWTQASCHQNWLLIIQLYCLRTTHKKSLQNAYRKYI